ncbi:helix-turn-helix domain-containing protein [Tenacibaculum ovolyticum]|uniref:winged helix-turn-helix transcriptional regulator n=1 Tax=Tenacibaculum ovolyticum TaxID=104270 RepID=UPI0022F3F9A3|nr:helix-turn-helix domain-containing protein [Tenacibaculum ovolyticum]WBX75760.1 helix-turn-helix domain-containing protein [Tenacibaculum ovolyticum]
MNQKHRSTCPISSALDIIGDKWSLLIIRDMMFSGKKTYTEFVNSSEKISTDILSNRLLKLVALELISKGKMEGNKKTNIYKLTQKGKELLPIILEIAQWSDNNLNDHLKDGAKPFVNKFKSNKEVFVENMYALFDKRES